MERMEKPKVRLTYGHIEHLDKDGFERRVCQVEFVRKYSVYANILSFLHVFRSRNGLGPYDAMPSHHPVSDHPVCRSGIHPSSNQEGSQIPPLLGQEESMLDEFVKLETPFDNWKEFLTAAYEWQASEDEITQLEERDFQKV